MNVAINLGATAVIENAEEPSQLHVQLSNAALVAPCFADMQNMPSTFGCEGLNL